MKLSGLITLKSTIYPNHLYSHLHHPHQTMWQNKVPNVRSWTITLVQSGLPPNNHHPLQWYHIDLSLYLMSLHPLMKLHRQYSILTIIIAPYTWHILSQPEWSPLITRPSHTRKCSKIRCQISQIFLGFPHLTLYNQLSLLTEHGTDRPSHSLNWMPLIQFKSSISYLATPLWYSL